MSHRRLAFLLLPILSVSSRSQEEKPSSQPAVDLEKALKSFLIEKKDPALRDCLTALAQKGKDGMTRLATLTTRVMKLAKKTAGDGSKTPTPENAAAETPKEANAWLEDLISGDETKADAAAAKLAEAGKSVAAPVKQLATRTDALYGRFIAAHIQMQMGTGAIFAGQYNYLRELRPDIEKVLLRFAKDAPPGMDDRTREGALRALRDVVQEKPSDELLKTLSAMATDQFEEPGPRKNAMWALAQFGDRTTVEAAIQEQAKRTKSEDVEEQAQGWLELAETHYNLYEYPAAIDAYKKALLLAEEGKWKDKDLSMHYYNAACSMSLAGKADEAFEFIDKAMVAGRKGTQGGLNRRLFESDKDIEKLRSDPRFPAMMEKYFGKSGAKKPAGDEERKDAGAASRKSGGKPESTPPEKSGERSR